MANKINLGCNQTRGTFAIVGKVTGRLSQNFYTEGNSANGRAWRRVTFGIEFEPDHVIYVQMFGSTQDVVYVNKRTTIGNKTTSDVQQVPWAKRFDYEKDPKYNGYQMIGVTTGCTQEMDKTGTMRNVVKHITPYDACAEVMNLSDGDSVYVRGNLEYSTYNDQHRVNFVLTQVSLRQPVDFEALDFAPYALFTQPMVLMGVDGNKETDEYDVTAKIVNYSSIEDAEFHISKSQKTMAAALKKLGSYVFVEANGDIVVSGEITEEEYSDEWGRSNKMKRVASPFVRKLMIAGVDRESIDKDAYSEEVIEHAMEVIANIKSAKDDYGSSNKEDWGHPNGGNFTMEDEEEDDLDLGL